MAIEKWQKIKEEKVFDRFKKVYRTTFRLPDGTLKDFDIMTSGYDVASIVGFTKSREAILVKQFRPGPEKVFYEFPLGFIEKEEAPLAAARREFLEETGYTGQFQDLGVVEYNGGYRKTGIYCFLALNCQKQTDQLNLDEGEFIEVELVPLLRLKEMLKKGQVRNFGQGYLALDHLGWL